MHFFKLSVVVHTDYHQSTKLPLENSECQIWPLEHDSLQVWVNLLTRDSTTIGNTDCRQSTLTRYRVFEVYLMMIVVKNQKAMWERRSPSRESFFESGWDAFPIFEEKPNRSVSLPPSMFPTNKEMLWRVSEMNVAIKSLFCLCINHESNPPNFFLSNMISQWTPIPPSTFFPGIKTTMLSYLPKVEILSIATYI